MSSLAEWGRELVALLFPYRCAACRKMLPAGQHWCEACLPKHLAPVMHPLQPGDPLDGLFTLAPYEGAVRQLFHLAKYHHNRDALAALAQLSAFAAARLTGQPVWQPAFRTAPLVLIPGDAQRLAARGVDIPHALFTAAFARQPMLPLLTRTRATAPQYSLNKEARRANVAGCFAVQPAVRPGGTLLLADDILTSGATLREAARTIKKAGAATVIGLALAHDNQQLFR